MSVIVPPASGSTPMDLSTEKTSTLLSQTTVADATSTAFDITSMATVRITIAPTSYTGTITFYASEDGTNYLAIHGRKQGTKTAATSVALSGSSTKEIWEFSVAGLKRLRVATTSSSGTAISITGRASPLDSSESLVSTAADTTIGGTTAPVSIFTIGGKTNDVTPQYHPIPEGAAGRSIIVEGYAGGTAQPISASSLPLPSGAATAAKQPALGTAGTASTDVISVQGIAAMTALLTDGSATTQPISAASLPLPTGAATAAKQPALGTAGIASADIISVQGIAAMTPLLTNGSATTQPISATSLPLPTGAATSASQTTANASLSSIDGKITTVNTGAVTVSSSALPTGAATAAKQPALGTAGTASADIISVQGIAAMTPLLTNGSATTQPVSAASLPLPTGASTAAKQPALGTAGTASADVITVQGVASMTPLQMTDGGTTATAIAAGTAGNTVIKASAGRLCRILVTTAGTNALMIYDNATTNTGTIIGAVAANAVAGTWVDAQMPAANGITVDGDGNNPAVTISFS